jgi:hypothetical protein
MSSHRASSSSCHRVIIVIIIIISSFHRLIIIVSSILGCSQVCLGKDGLLSKVPMLAKQEAWWFA